MNSSASASASASDKKASDAAIDWTTRPYIEEPWDVIQSYFEGAYLDRLVRHQTESFNNFIECQIPRTIDMFNPKTIRSDADFDRDSGKYRLEVIVTFTDFRVYRPQIHENNGAIKLMFPQEARLRGFTYSSSSTIDLNVQYIIRGGDDLETTKVIHKTYNKIPIGKIPIMLKSNLCVLRQYSHVDHMQNGECKYDAGGYFIINGSEKTVIAQERAAENRVYIYNVSKTTTKHAWSAEIKSVPDFKCISPKYVEIYTSSKNNGFGHPICVSIPRVSVLVPLFIVFRAIGVVTDRDICEHVVLDMDAPGSRLMLAELHASILEANAHLTTEACVKYLAANVTYTPYNMDREQGNVRKYQFALDVLQNDLFPHCPTPRQKAVFLGYAVQKLLRVHLGEAEPDDRDSYLNKRVDTTGTSLNNLFRNHFNRLGKDMEKQIVREINNGSWRSTENYADIINSTNIYKIIKSSIIENGFKRALSTGDFGTIKHAANSTKVGVAQVLNRLTYIAGLSHLRRVSTPVDKSGKLVPPRKLNNTSWGFICPAETPEGGSVGIVKNLSYMTHVTLHSSSEPLHDVVSSEIQSIDRVELREAAGCAKVFINGAWTGITRDPMALYTRLKRLKTSGRINVYTSIIFDCAMGEIRVCNDCGRLTRPVLRVVDGKLLLTDEMLSRLRSKSLTWDELMTTMVYDNAVIEYIDPDEQNHSMIAMSPKHLTQTGPRRVKYTHCEIHPSTIFGIVASCNPFPEHNQSPRNTYQCAQAKQAMGIYATNFDLRMDKTSYVLTTPGRPLIDTRVMNIIKLNEFPSGYTAMVAIMAYTGYNQEDSIIVNQGAIDRGLLQVTLTHTEKDDDKHRVNGDEEVRCRPDRTKTRGMKFGNYDKVNTKGVVPQNTFLENGDVIIAKKTPIKENRNNPAQVMKFDDQSRTVRLTEEAYVDKTCLDKNGDGYNFAKVRVRIHRAPVIGDKFSSRHGQKGTVSNILPESDMPFTRDGVRPDIIINPHAIPSRMTIGQLKESLLGCVLLQLGLFGDGTSFGELSRESICKKLLELGHEAHGNELMYDGLTGRQLECSIFFGPVFYQRLKHMVNDKQHSRSSGPMIGPARQPAEGRARNGGLRFGEMERDCMISHGASRFTRERLYDASDKFAVHVCKNCGLIATFNDRKSIHHCHACSNRTAFAYVEIPYACKLLFQELTTMSVVPRLLTNH